MRTSTVISNAKRCVDSVRRLEGARSAMREEVDGMRQRLRENNVNQEHAQTAARIVQVVAKKTQDHITHKISHAITTGLSAIFPEPYEMKLEFVPRRGKTEADLFFERDGERIDPLSAAGGGVADVTAYGLRLCIWSMTKNSRPTFLLDEPFKFVSPGLVPEVGALLRETAEKMGVQFIIITHDTNIADEADKLFSISQMRDEEGDLVSVVRTGPLADGGE